MSEIENVQALLHKPLTDADLIQGQKLIDYMMRLELSETEGELALAVALAMYTKHRALMGDKGATERILNIADKVRPNIRFKTSDDLAQQHVDGLRKKGLI